MSPQNRLDINHQTLYQKSDFPRFFGALCTFEYRPCQDITVFELATIVPILILDTRKEDVYQRIMDLPPALKRHFYFAQGDEQKTTS